MTKFVAAMLTMLTLALHAQEASFEAFTGAVLGSKVRLRTQPTLESHVVAETSAGQLFGIIGEEKDYYAVQPPRGIKGYVFRTFVLDNIIEGERVNVRLYPDIEAPVIARLNTGDRVTTYSSDANSKWLEIDLPHSAHFYIAKEYIEKKGDLALIKQHETRQSEAAHLLRAACLYAQNEIQKSFPQIEIANMEKKFGDIAYKYSDIADVVANAQEAVQLMQELYTQKKIAFLESRANSGPSVVRFNQDHVARLAALGIEVEALQEESVVTGLGGAFANTIGVATTLGSDQINDKMLVWQPVEEALFHLWAAANNTDSMEEFYASEDMHAIYISGQIEPYSRPVKNLPGDFMLKNENQPVAFLYSTKVDLSKVVGRNVTVRVAPRPNNHFAFPAYYVLSVE